MIDPPQQPFAPQPKTKKAVLTVAMALVLGSVLAVAGVVIGTHPRSDDPLPGGREGAIEHADAGRRAPHPADPRDAQALRNSRGAAPAIASVPAVEDVDDSRDSLVSALPVDKAADNGAVGDAAHR